MISVVCVRLSMARGEVFSFRKQTAQTPSQHNSVYSFKKFVILSLNEVMSQW